MATALRTPGSAVLVDMVHEPMDAVHAAISSSNITAVVFILPDSQLSLARRLELQRVELQLLGKPGGLRKAVVGVTPGGPVQWRHVRSMLADATMAAPAGASNIQHLWDFTPLAGVHRVQSTASWDSAPLTVRSMLVGPPGWQQASGPVLLLSAHVDCFTLLPDLPGCADANASGVAVLLALLRRFASMTLDSNMPMPVLLFSGGGSLHWQGARDVLAGVGGLSASRVAAHVALERLGTGGSLWAHATCTSPAEDGTCGADPKLPSALQSIVQASAATVRWKSLPQAAVLEQWEHEASARRGIPSMTLSAAPAPGDSALGLLREAEQSDDNATAAKAGTGQSSTQAKKHSKNMLADSFIGAGPLGGRWSMLDSAGGLQVQNLAAHCTAVVHALAPGMTPCDESALLQDVQDLAQRPRSPAHLSEPGHPALRQLAAAAHAASWHVAFANVTMDLDIAPPMILPGDATLVLFSLRPLSWEVEAFLLAMAYGVLLYLLAAGPSTCPCKCYRRCGLWACLGYRNLSPAHAKVQ